MSDVVSDLSEELPAKREASAISRIKRVWRLVTVLTRMDIKLRYGDSALGYVWTIGKPLALFSILYVVFGRLVRFGAPMPHYTLYLVIGVMLWSFFAEGVTRTMGSIVANGTLLRKLPFPRLVIPLSASLTAFVTFGLSLLAIAVFVAWNGLVPRLDWLVLIPELIELYLVVLGLGLVLGIIYVRLRDISQVWELASQLLFFLSPIIYPFEMVPPRVRQVMLLNPFTQVMQDVRAIIIYPDHAVIVAPAAFSPLRLLPLVIAAFVLGLGFLLFKLEEPWLPERV
jgi:ABC-2 type transport system permease protein